MKVTITVDAERTGAGDFVVRGVDESGRTSVCLASYFGDDALASAKMHVRDDLYRQARQEILERLAAVKDEIVEDAKVWYDGWPAPANLCALSDGVRKLHAGECDLIALGSLPSSQPPPTEIP